ncbi:protein Shroom2 isoform X2 [Callorhinchus milii]|uniref:protein Shroom2 isoform X2 n=1 Tax=Callorhinchus milii TaxID=7868 RepID=UPI001C3FB272|nr:protein Shroom2 isoform X2 [Callorhinchus milii]
MAGEGVRTKGAAGEQRGGSQQQQQQPQGSGTEQQQQQRSGREPRAWEHRGTEGYKSVEVVLSGGAPWGFTLRGGREHREPLLITKIEDESKAAAVGKLQVGDEIISINDVILTGYRQEAICLVKGSHKVLKIIVRRRNEPVSRPHSWHSTKFIDSQPEPAMMQLSNTGVCASWHSRYYATSSSNDLSNSWDQTNLCRISDQFSSLGSMDSLDQPPQIYQQERLSPTRSSNSMDHIAQHNKRDSAYSSFSTSSSTPDYTLSSSRNENSSSTENMLNKMGHWDAARHGNGRHSQNLGNQSGLEDKQGYLAPGVSNEERFSPRPDEQLSSRHHSAGRPNFGPIWHIPSGENRISKMLSPPPPPPVRSDSFAVTKVHEKTHVSAFADVCGPPHYSALSKPQPRGGWIAEVPSHVNDRGKEGRENPYNVTNVCETPHTAFSPSADSNKHLSESRLQYSLSSSDIRFPQPTYSSHHQRQSSDEGNFYHSDRAVFPSKPPHSGYCSSMQELPTQNSHYYNPIQIWPTKTPSPTAPAVHGISPGPENAGQSRYFCITSRQPPPVNIQPSQIKVDYWENSKAAAITPGQVEDSNNPAPSMGQKQPKYYHSQQPSLSLNDNSGLGRVETCKARMSVPVPDNVITQLMDEEKGSQWGNSAYSNGKDPTGSSCSHQLGFKNSIGSSESRHQPKEPWMPDGDSIAICPHKTPMLHSLTQENESLQENWMEGSVRQQLYELSLAKQMRRSDRFATALRNEIQMKRAQLQKSRSAAALAGPGELEEDVESWKEESTGNSRSSSDGSFSSSYKDNLKEAQARVLKATSFKRRDLEPVLTEYRPKSPECSAFTNSAASSTLGPRDGSLSAFLDTAESYPDPPVGGSHHVSRVGGRKRFTQEQKLRSYSEPEKMNEVGMSEDVQPPQPPRKTNFKSFADRRKFFEESSKTGHPTTHSKPSPKHNSQRAAGELASGKSRKPHSTEAEEPGQSVAEGRARAASLGFESALADHPKTKDLGPDPAWDLSRSSSQGNVVKQSSLPERQEYFVNPSEKDVSTHETAGQPEPQRLGTFAEYQATWREQRKVSEARSSGRYHSADNILDQSSQEPVKIQYVHERSRSSPSKDFYAQDVPIEVRKQPDSFHKAMEYTAATVDNRRSSSSMRQLDPGCKEITSEGERLSCEQTLEHQWKTSSRNVQTSELQSQEDHSRSVTVPSSYWYPETNEGEIEKKVDVLVPQTCPKGQALNKYWTTGEELAWAEEKLAAESNRRRLTAPQRPPPPKVDKHRRQETPNSGLIAASNSAPTEQSGSSQMSTNAAEVSNGSTETPLPPKVAVNPEPQLDRYPASDYAQTGKPQVKGDNKIPSFHFFPKPSIEVPRTPSPQFAPQRLTDKPPLTVEDDSLARIEKVMENNTTVKKVPIKIVRSESQTEKESRQNLLNNVEPLSFPFDSEKEQLKTIGTSEHSYSLFSAYSRHEQEQLKDKDVNVTEAPLTDAATSDSKESEQVTAVTNYMKAKNIEDPKSEELAREIVDKDKSLADILYPNSKMKTTMDLMEGIFPKDEALLEEAQQRRKLLPKSLSPKAMEERNEEETTPIGVSLTTSSTYYSTSAPKAELLNKLKDMQQQMEEEEDSEDELNHDLTEKKQELIDSISKKLQVLREARESLQDDIQANNLLGGEVEVYVKEVCKPNEFDKFKMFIGDLDKVVNLLLSLSGRLARVENALNTLDESASPEERRTLTQKQKLLTRQHEDAKELKENLDRREKVVFEILSSYLTEEHLQDYEHFVKMKSALIIEQRELEDKIKLGEEQLKCLLDSLPPDSKPK